MAIQKITTNALSDSAVTSTKIDSAFTTSITTNPEFLGTSHIRVPVGTSEQRPESPVAGHLRFNTTVGKLEQYDGTDWAAIDAPPVVTSVSPSSELASDDPQSIVITGSNFTSTVTVRVIGNDLTEYIPTTVTRNSSGQVTITFAGGDILTGTNEPYDVKVINSSSLSSTLEDAFNINDIPTWVTSSGSLLTTVEGDSVSTTVSATDPESVGITYSVVSGSLPSGVSLNTSTGAITGTAPSVASDTTYNFSLGASDGSNTTQSRSFSIAVKDIETSVVNIFKNSNYYGVNASSNFTWSTNDNTGNWGSVSYVADQSTSSSLEANSYQHGADSFSGELYIQVDIGAGRYFRPLRTAVVGYSSSHFSRNNYIKASNDGTNWTTILTWSNHTGSTTGYLQGGQNANVDNWTWVETNKTSYWMSTTATTGYRYFRLGGTAWNVSNGYQIVNNWHFWGLPTNSSGISLI